MSEKHSDYSEDLNSFNTNFHLTINNIMKQLNANDNQDNLQTKITVQRRNLDQFEEIIISRALYDFNLRLAVAGVNDKMSFLDILLSTLVDSTKVRQLGQFIIDKLSKEYIVPIHIVKKSENDYATRIKIRSILHNMNNQKFVINNE